MPERLRVSPESTWMAFDLALRRKYCQWTISYFDRVIAQNDPYLESLRVACACCGRRLYPSKRTFIDGIEKSTSSHECDGATDARAVCAEADFAILRNCMADNRPFTGPSDDSHAY